MPDDQTPESESQRENRVATDEEVHALEESFVRAMRDGRGGSQPYVAAPAPGHDVHGLWHCFGAGHRSGYATHAAALHWVVDKLIGIPMQLIPHRNMDIDIDEFPSDRYDMLFDWTRKAVGHPHLVFSSFPPSVSAQMSMIGPPLVPYIAFEATRVSRATVDLCSGDAFREVWVVHPFVKDALVDSGVPEERVRVVRPMLVGGPWPERMFRPMAEIESADMTSDVFTFGAMGTWHERKGFHDLVRAYFSAFKREDPVRLVIRTSPLGKKLTIKEFKEQLTEEIGAIAAEFGDEDFPVSQRQPRLSLILGTAADDAEIIEWLGGLDCYVNASYGEGLGIPHLWAKAQGVPMITTCFGAVGQTMRWISLMGSTEDEFVPHEETSVPAEMSRFSTMFSAESLWGSYDVADLASAMVMSYERGRRRDAIGARFVREDHGEEKATASVRDGLRALLDAQLLQDWGVE